MNKSSMLIGVGISVGLGVAIYDCNPHAIIGWALALGYFACFELNEGQIRKMQDEKRLAERPRQRLEKPAGTAYYICVVSGVLVDMGV